ncbi:hypothetical protein ACDQ55_14415 [Chitinophaga sp. 30R24]|uniref:hypothetical protein n=1 Tax=Chitinophaga sp. 30R24 TaxID=3248838 RepID=UPI003B8F38CE
MNKILMYSSLFVLVALNITLLVMKQKEPKQKVQDDDVTFHLKASKSYHKQTVVNSLLNNNTHLPDSILLTDINDQKVFLKSLVNGGTKIVVRNNEEGCSLCIEHELDIIKKYADSLGNENVIVITTHSNVRKLKVFVQTNHIPFNVYYCQSLNIPYEWATQKPFVFTLTPQLIVNNFFIPEVSETEISEAYYNTIYQLIFKSYKTSRLLTDYNSNKSLN